MDHHVLVKRQAVDEYLPICPTIGKADMI
uniref:Uncharacterized protein n=1 Tax=Anguilla anguilla TaxID=7936 RepID=A0A0E9S9C5_ANGAN